MTSLSDTLIGGNRDVWDAMQDHRFVRDIEADRLDPAVFRRYLVYERDFVEAAIVIVGRAMILAPDIATQRHLIGVLGALANDQIAYFDDAFAALGIDPAATAGPLPASVGAFRDGMLAMAAAGGYADIITGMFAAEWMYWTWCSRADAGHISDPVLRRWVALHAAEDFATGARWLKAQVDAAGMDLLPRGRERLAGIFRRTLELEIAFHAAPYET
jgi:thiaminase/transcriptional activator TenA